MNERDQCMTTSPYRLSPEVLEAREREREERLQRAAHVIYEAASESILMDCRKAAEQVAAVLIPKGHEVRPAVPR